MSHTVNTGITRTCAYMHIHIVWMNGHIVQPVTLLSCKWSLNTNVHLRVHEDTLIVIVE